nr:unnamed protein product [Haemonchus contortus]
MSQENTNMSAPSRLGNSSPGPAGFIDWYDSPKILFPSQTKTSRRSLLLMKTKSAEEFSPSQSSLNETPSTSDFDSLWCPSTSNENMAPFEEDESACDIFAQESSQYNTCSTTPHRSRRFENKHLRRKRMRSDQDEVAENNSKDRKDSRESMSMEEGLALGRASLVKLRQRLRSEGDAADSGKQRNDSRCRTPHRTTLQSTPNVTPISKETQSKKASDVTITPSLVRSQATSKFSTSTPKRSTIRSATPLKRFRTMNDDKERAECLPKEKIARTQSMNVTNDGSDDDSFLDDIFMPFSNPNQFSQMLKQGVSKK